MEQWRQTVYNILLCIKRDEKERNSSKAAVKSKDIRQGFWNKLLFELKFSSKRITIFYMLFSVFISTSGFKCYFEISIVANVRKENEIQPLRFKHTFHSIRYKYRTETEKIEMKLPSDGVLHFTWDLIWS